MASLKYIQFYVFSQYFDHLKNHPCVSIELFTHNHMVGGKFPHGFVWLWLYMACLNVIQLDVFRQCFDHLKNYPWKLVKFYVVFGCK
jgi:hypothetical protein